MTHQQVKTEHGTMDGLRGIDQQVEKGVEIFAVISASELISR
jgi:hypothetical protein